MGTAGPLGERLQVDSSSALTTDCARATDTRVVGCLAVEELAAVLDLAGMFPARHAPTLEFPPFGR